MSATDQMRAMLDQLMGTTRNGENSPILTTSFYTFRAKLLGKPSKIVLILAEKVICRKGLLFHMQNFLLSFK
jgi:hypothetical protein